MLAPGSDRRLPLVFCLKRRRTRDRRCGLRGLRSEESGSGRKGCYRDRREWLCCLWMVPSFCCSSAG